MWIWQLHSRCAQTSHSIRSRELTDLLTTVWDFNFHSRRPHRIWRRKWMHEWRKEAGTLRAWKLASYGVESRTHFRVRETTSPSTFPAFPMLYTILITNVSWMVMFSSKKHVIVAKLLRNILHCSHIVLRHCKKLVTSATQVFSFSCILIVCSTMRILHTTEFVAVMKHVVWTTFGKKKKKKKEGWD